MDFTLAAQRFIQLEQMRRSGQLSEADYTAQLGAVRVTDPQGRTWMLQAHTGAWYVWDGAQWQAAAPPGMAAQVAMPQPAPAQPAYTPQPAAAPQPMPTYAPQPVQPAYTQQPQPQAGYGQAGGAGYVPPGAVSPVLVAKRKRPGCFGVTLSMILFSGLMAGVAWLVDAFWQPMPTWGYYAVALLALGVLILWVRRLTRYGRQARKLVAGGAR